MLNKPTSHHAIQGFTLLEILVAFAVFGIVGTALLQLFQSGLGHIDRSHKMSQAVLLAQSQIAELQTQRDLQPGEIQGDYAQGYRWHLQLEPYWATLSEPNHRFQAFTATLRIEWGDQGEYQLKTLLLGTHTASR